MRSAPAPLGLSLAIHALVFGAGFALLKSEALLFSKSLSGPGTAVLNITTWEGETNPTPVRKTSSDPKKELSKQNVAGTSSPHLDHPGDPTHAGEGSASVTAGRSYHLIRSSIARSFQSHARQLQALGLKNTRYLAKITLTIDSSGKIRKLGIEESSGNMVFDEVVLDSVRGAAPFEMAEAGLSEDLTFSIPLEYRRI